MRLFVNTEGGFLSEVASGYKFWSVYPTRLENGINFHI